MRFGRVLVLGLMAMVLVVGCGLSSFIEKRYEPAPGDALPPDYRLLETAEEIPPGAGPERVIVYWLVEAPEGTSRMAGLDALTESVSELGLTQYEQPEGFSVWWTAAFGAVGGGPSATLGTKGAFLEAFSSATVFHITEAFAKYPTSTQRPQFVVVFGPT